MTSRRQFFSIISGASLVAVAMPAKRDDRYISVKDFGAKGDGITDDTPGIQAAIDKAHKEGRRFTLRPGTYYLTSGIVIRGECSICNCTLIGSGGKHAAISVPSAAFISR
jgi:hypothetical protein